YLGIGPGAHSFCATPSPRRWWNVRLPHRWRATVAERGTAVDGEELLTEAQARADFVITGLRRHAGADVAVFERRLRLGILAAFPQLPHLEREGLVELRDARLRLSQRGLRFADTVGALLV